MGWYGHKREGWWGFVGMVVRALVLKSERFLRLWGNSRGGVTNGNGARVGAGRRQNTLLSAVID